MKKNIFIAFLTIFALMACSEDVNDAKENNIPGVEGSYIKLQMYLPQSEVGAISTRANETTSPGEDQYNENYINNVDVFFYSAGSTDTDAPLYYLMGCNVEQSESTTHYNHDDDDDHTDCLYTVYVRVTDDDLTKIFGSNMSNKIDCYVIGNRPWSGYDESEGYTRESLKQTELHTAWASQLSEKYTFVTSGEMDSMTPSSTTDGSGNTQVTLSGIVPLYRSAAKIQCYLKVAESAEVTDDDGNKTTWYSDPEHLTVSFYNGATRGMVDDIPENLGTQDDDYYLIYGRGGAKLTEAKTHEETDENDATVTEEYLYTHQPFYSYPRTWEDFEADGSTARVIICVPWYHKNEDGTVSSHQNTYYQFSANRLSNEFKKNTFYQLYIDITSPGNTTEAIPVEVSPLGYTIAPWGKVDTYQGEKGNMTDVFSRYDYLVVMPTDTVVKDASSVTFDYSSSTSITAKVIYAEYNNYSTAGTTTTTKYKSPDDDSEIEKDYGVTIDDKEHTITVTHNFTTGACVKHVIKVLVESSSGLTETLTITQYPEIYISTVEGDNVFVNGYFAHVFNNGTLGTRNEEADDDSYYKPLEYSKEWDGWNQKYYYYYTTNYGSLVGLLSSTGGSLTNNRLIQVTVTSFNSENGYYTYYVNNTSYTYYYKIGDPRVSAGYNYNSLALYQNNKGNTKSWNNTAAKAIMIGTTTEDGRQIIAPKFMLASAWSSSSPHTFEEAQKRAATFQEGGYPAGRWRLPTEAEIQFCVHLQNEGIIPKQFGTETYYWASSGRAYYKPENGNPTFVTPTSRNYVYSRPVYDLWYWGEDAQKDATKYYIMPDGDTNYVED